MMLLDTIPDDVGRWFAALSAEHRAFLREHDLLIPFAYYGWPGPFAAGALANADVQRHMVDYPDIWSRDRIERMPEMRFEFDIVVAFGGMEVFRWSAKKNWGPLRWIAPLQPDDEISAQFLGCFHKPHSPYRQRMEQRGYLRHKLGRFSGLVSLAMKSTSLSRFVDTLNYKSTSPAKTADTLPGQRSLLPILSDAEIAAELKAETRRRDFTFYRSGNPFEAIREKLGMSPERFFRVAKGREKLPESCFTDPQRDLFAANALEA